MTNHILERNLEQIKRYNPNLVAKILSVTELKNNIALCETNLKEPNLSYNSVSIHSMEGADLEAQSVFKTTTDNLNHVHLIFGLGLGYLFKEFCDKAKGAIILYEPDIEILRVTLEIVDFSKELSKERVFIVSDYIMLEKLFYSVYAFGSKTKMHFLNYHKNYEKEQFDGIKTEITRLNSIIANNTNFQKKNFYYFLNSTIDGLEERITIPPLQVLENKFKDIPAIVVSAGPSLSKNIEVLKQLQDKAIIFCVGTAFKILTENGIKPDFLNVIEMYDCSTQIEDQKTEDLNFISEGFTNKAFHGKFNYKNKFLTLSRENIVNIWLAKLLNVDDSIYQTRGTVSYNALHSAKILGCNPIILIGQDLAYADNKVYADNSPYSALKIRTSPITNKPEIYVEDYEKYRQAYFPKGHEFSLPDQEYVIGLKIQELNESLAFVKGQDGNPITTEQGYALFLEYFKDFARENKDNITLINSSMGGAYIDGFKHMPLQDSLLFCKKSKPNIDEIIKNISYNADFNLIIENIKAEIRLLKNINDSLKHAQVDLRNLKREFARCHQVTKRSNQYLKNCLDSFLQISQIYKKNSAIVFAITMDEEVSVNWLLKEHEFDQKYESQLELQKALEKYFIKNNEKVEITIKKLTETLDKIVSAQNKSLSLSQ